MSLFFARSLPVVDQLKDGRWFRVLNVIDDFSANAWPPSWIHQLAVRV